MWFRSALTLAAMFATFAPQAAPRGPVVVFDEGHGQRFHAEGKGPLDLSDFAALITAKGGTVRTSRGALQSTDLETVDALVVSGAFERISGAEIDRIIAFVERGGRLCVMLHIEPPLADLLHRLNVSVSTGVIHEQSGAMDANLDFRVTRLRPHPITRGLTSVALYGAWALLPTKSNARAIAETSPRAWIDLNHNRTLDRTDAVQSFAVVVSGRHGKGIFAVFGDDALFQNQFLKGENRKLGENLAAWLTRSDVETAQVLPPAGSR